MSEVIERAKKFLNSSVADRNNMIYGPAIIQELIAELDKTIVECSRLEKVFKNQGNLRGRIAELESQLSVSKQYDAEVYIPTIEQLQSELSQYKVI